MSANDERLKKAQAEYYEEENTRRKAEGWGYLIAIGLITWGIVSCHNSNSDARDKRAAEAARPAPAVVAKAEPDTPAFAKAADEAPKPTHDIEAARRAGNSAEPYCQSLQAEQQAWIFLRRAAGDESEAHGAVLDGSPSHIVKSGCRYIFVAGGRLHDVRIEFAGEVIVHGPEKWEFVNVTWGLEGDLSSVADLALAEGK